LRREFEIAVAHEISLTPVRQHRIAQSRGAAIVQIVLAQAKAYQRRGAPVGAGGFALHDLVVQRLAHVV